MATMRSTCKVKYTSKVKLYSPHITQHRCHMARGRKRSQDVMHFTLTALLVFGRTSPSKLELTEVFFL